MIVSKQISELRVGDKVIYNKSQIEYKKHSATIEAIERFAGVKELIYIEFNDDTERVFLSEEKIDIKIPVHQRKKQKGL